MLNKFLSSNLLKTVPPLNWSLTLGGSSRDKHWTTKSRKFTWWCEKSRQTAFLYDHRSPLTTPHNANPMAFMEKGVHTTKFNILWPNGLSSSVTHRNNSLSPFGQENALMQSNANASKGEKNAQQDAWIASAFCVYMCKNPLKLNRCQPTKLQLMAKA